MLAVAVVTTVGVVMDDSIRGHADHADHADSSHTYSRGGFLTEGCSTQWGWFPQVSGFLTGHRFPTQWEHMGACSHL